MGENKDKNCLCIKVRIIYTCINVRKQSEEEHVERNAVIFSVASFIIPNT